MSPQASRRQKRRYMETCSSLKQDRQHFLVIPRSCSLALNIFSVHSYLGPRPRSWRLQSANVTWILPITNTRRIVLVDTMTGSSAGQWARWVTALHHQTFSHQSDHTRRAGTSSKKFNPLMETRTFFFPPLPSEYRIFHPGESWIPYASPPCGPGG